MKIYLYLINQIFTFSLPNDAMGSYSFDYEPEEENKLINVENKEGSWYIYSTKEVKLIQNGSVVESLLLEHGTFYYLKRKDKEYLISFSNLLQNKTLTYTYNNNTNLLIGNTNSTNIKYNCPILGQLLINIRLEDNKFILEHNNSNNNFNAIYINNQTITTPKYYLQIGDKISILNLKIIFLKNILIIISPTNLVINETNANIKKYSFPPQEKNQNIEIKENDLYEKDKYYSKSPRIRRIIETKTIKLSPPPKDGNNSELPMILTIGPMLTMGVTSAVTLMSTITNIKTGKSTIQDQWPSLITSTAMLVSMLMWPLITKIYNKKLKKRKTQELITKYGKYLDEKRKELENEANTQKEILIENLITINQCLEIITNKSLNFWGKRIDQSDFLVVRIGYGKELLDVKVEYPEEGFTVDEDELRKQADKMVEDFKYINDVPVSYSLYDNKVTAIMGNINSAINFVNNIILQLLTFYSYDDLKLVVFTQEKYESNWEYIKYLNHNFSNDLKFRYFASDNDSYRMVAEFLNYEVNYRTPRAKESKIGEFKPHYIIIIDGYEKVKRFDFIKTLIEMDENIGFSIIIIEDRLSKLPSKCNNFITLGVNSSGVLKNSYEKQEQITFRDEIVPGINMMNISKILANIPIEFEEGSKNLPDAITFLEMEKVGKVEQLNILNRWNNNNATSSLRTEIGVDEQGDLMYLDLHEKYHGPHGLIAGTTGSGKSEFIITYILSMAINYSPDDVSFILIDYKGGGLALAFENKATGVSLPHLAGTITNLDKAEMDRTLVSIDSEVKRRQRMFNEARDKLGESTIDIYKYQAFYNEGRVEEPIPHLFIICDEFAELKSQQPEFMDNLISVARIGRSLGVHLILATQKPSGVVNDQIWSNTKFRVCLKVQDESDSKEMLKRPEAAAIKQVGRYYLQVGYDEYFALGQSGWCGAKYYPSDTIVKNIDKSINFINDCGMFIKSIQASSGIKKQPQGEQLSAIMKNIIEVSNRVGKKAKRLWLENIPEIILINNLEIKYNITPIPYQLEAIIGEYDAPESQQQGVVKYNYLTDGNTIIYGNDGSEREKLIETIIYSTVKNHKANEINFYIIDYGSEFLTKYNKLAHVGGVVVASEEEKYNNLLKFLKEELKRRKKLFANYGGEYSNYIKQSQEKLPIYTIIINNYDSVYEANPDIFDILPELVRDSERYGIVYIITGNAINSVQNKISSNFDNIYAFKLKDTSDYASVFNTKVKTVPRDIFARGLLKTDNIHEFQTASITPDKETINDHLIEFISKINQENNFKALNIPTLPNVVRLENVNKNNINLNNIPVGIIKKDLGIASIDYLSNIGNIITSNKLENTKTVVSSLIKLFASLQNTNLIIIDPLNALNLNQQIYPNYYTDNLNKVTDIIINYLNKLNENKSINQGVVVIYGLNKFISKVDDNKKILTLIKAFKTYEKYSLIIVDDYSKLKNYVFDDWFKELFSINDGIWIGRGLSEQNLFRLATITKEMIKDIKNDMGYLIHENLARLIKLIDFVNPFEEE